MNVVAVEVPEHGNRAHLVHDGEVALVVDPPRNLRCVEKAADLVEVEIVAVAETHIHNDYVSGGLALARRHGADYLLSADENVSFSRVGLRDGDIVHVGRLAVKALWTPGHTPTHLSFLARGEGRPGALFSGGSLLYGTVGRTDLTAPTLTEDLARKQWESVRRLGTLDPATTLHPTHGFGSFCASSTVVDATGRVTTGDQLAANPVFRTTQERYVPDLMAGFGPVPSYYAHMAPRNRAGAGAQPVREPRPIPGHELAAALAGGTWVIDLRSRAAFAEAHLPGTVNIEYCAQFATYAGWLAPWGACHVLLADDAEALGDAARDLAGLGVDDLRAHLLPHDAALPRPVGYQRTDWVGFADAADPRVVLDVRQQDEYEHGHLPGAVHIPLQDVDAQDVEIPPGTVWVHCRSGYRAGIAASLLHRRGREVVHVDDDWARALALGLDRRPAA